MQILSKTDECTFQKKGDWCQNPYHSKTPFLHCAYCSDPARDEYYLTEFGDKKLYFCCIRDLNSFWKKAEKEKQEYEWEEKIVLEYDKFKKLSKKQQLLWKIKNFKRYKECKRVWTYIKNGYKFEFKLFPWKFWEDVE